jgi:hypothetical protein
MNCIWYAIGAFVGGLGTGFALKIFIQWNRGDSVTQRDITAGRDVTGRDKISKD